jgi:VWFA-related protein
LAAALSVSGPLIPTGAQETQAGPPDPHEVDYIEETGVELMLLDVEVYDNAGRPLRGLSKEDFTLTINGRVRQLYSVDDLCPCMEQPAAAGRAPAEVARDDMKAESTSAAGYSEPMTYILYINFGQLQQDGRIQALEEVRRWIEETMSPGDRVRLMAWSAQAGLSVLTPLTRDKARLLGALAKAERSKEFVDPFPVLRPIRQREVRECFERCKGGASSSWDRGDCSRCEMMATDYAQQEYLHGKRSMAALQQALYALEREPGRKSMLYFFQNDTMVPAALFLGVRQQHVMDHVRTLDRTAADANLARTSITAAYSGSDPEPSAINVGANLADYTGGAYSRAAHLMPAVTDEAGRGCRCLYRLGVTPPARGGKRVYNASVWVHDQQVHRRYRLQYLSRFDRWLREAQAALASPELMDDLSISASLVPVGCDDNGWSVAVQVIVSADDLLLLPSADGRYGSWEAGALLVRDDGSNAEEFLARSRLSMESEKDSGAFIVHEEIVEGLPHGTWRLGAFVRDRNASIFGGAQRDTYLPEPGEAGLSTPLLQQAGRAWIRTELPALKKKGPKATHTGKAGEAPLSLAGQPVLPGAPLEAKTWICAPRKGGIGRLLRYLVKEEEPIFRMEQADPPPAGRCEELVDVIETAFLAPGEYIYRIRYSLPKENEGLEDEAAFMVVEPPTEPGGNIE